MNLTAVPTLVVAATLVRTRCPVCDGPLTVEGYAPVQAPPGYGCSCCRAPILPACDLPPTSLPVPPVPVYCPLPQASAPVPVVVSPRIAQAPEPKSVPVAPRDRPIPAAPRLVTFKRMAPCQCYSCKGTIAAGTDCTLDAKGRMLHPACLGSRKASTPAPAKAPKDKPPVVVVTPDVAKAFGLDKFPPELVQVVPPAPTYLWSLCAEANGLQHDAHVLDRECIERALAKRDADDAARLAALAPKPEAAKPAPAAPIAKPEPKPAPVASRPECDWIVKRIEYSPDVRYHLWVEGENLSASNPADRAFRWHVASASNLRYDLSNALIDPKAVPYLGREVVKPAALFSPAPVAQTPKPEAPKPVASKPPVPQRTTRVDAFMLDDLCRALNDLRSKPESADDVGKAAEKALGDLETALDTEEPIVDKCIEEAADLLTEYEAPETTVEALRARLDEARTKLESVQGAVTHLVSAIRDAHSDAKDKVEDLATLQQRNAENAEDIDVEALVQELDYRGYRIVRVRR